MEPFDHPNCSKQLLVTNGFSVVVNQENPLSKAKRLSLEEVADERLILLNEEFQLYDIILDSYKKREIEPNIVFKSKQWDLLINMVAHNPNSISILPSPIVAMYQRDNLVSIPVELDTEWKIMLVERNSMKPTEANQKFISFVSAWFHELK
nr:LysR substrate-binding domain-containing protein [Listeria floridensis]